jgi:hypothetical protein
MFKVTRGVDMVKERIRSGVVTLYINFKAPKCLSKGKYLDILRCVHNMEYYAAIKNPTSKLGTCLTIPAT